MQDEKKMVFEAWLVGQPYVFKNTVVWNEAGFEHLKDVWQARQPEIDALNERVRLLQRGLDIAIKELDALATYLHVHNMTPSHWPIPELQALSGGAAGSVLAPETKGE